MAGLDHKPTASAEKTEVNYSPAGWGVWFFLGKVDTVLLAGPVESNPG